MSARYVAVQWNKAKLIYDAIMLAAVAGYLVIFLGITFALSPAADPLVAMIRASSTGALLLLHLTLAIGPLTRLTDRALPILYNRRHLGVTTFALAALHVLLVLFWYGFGGVADPLTPLVAEHKSLTSIAAFPAELLGFGAFAILFIMAATSHDFYLANLGPRAWKAIHMSVYLAYALAIAHAALMTFRESWSPLVLTALAIGMLALAALHLAAGLRETARDAADAHAVDPPEDGVPWVRACRVDEIPESRAKVVSLPGDVGPRERVAIFRHLGALTAVTNVCAHQGGPLGEGKIVDGCITCPWHGYQYDPATGQSPPPYTERIATYRVALRGDEVLVDPRPLPPGTPTTPVTVSAADERGPAAPGLEGHTT